MEAVNTEVAAVIDLGRTWGMSDSEISDCLLKSVDPADKSKLKPVSQSRSSSSGFCNLLSWLAFGGQIFLIIIAVLVLLYCAEEALDVVSPELGMKIQAAVSTVNYPVMRWSRKLFKPFADIWDISGLYNSECMINNPFFIEEVPDCFPCKGLTSLYDATKDTQAELFNYMDTVTAFKFRKFSADPPTYEDIQKMYRKNEVKFLPGSHSLTTNLPNNPNMSTILSMSEDELRVSMNGQAKIRWNSNGVPTAQAVRRLFPRPWFIPVESEISLEKSIIISGPDSEPFNMPMNAVPLTWYQQVKGSRKITLYPHPDCESECNILEDTIHPGDLVLYQDQYWKLESQPDSTEHRDELSIGFVGSFSL